MALFCTARPLTDVVIECKEVGAARDIPVKTMPCRVQKMEKVAHDVMVLYLKLPANERLQFLAGQYIDILLKDGKRRSFSLANAPHDDEFLQLHIRHIPGGLFTDNVFNSMQEKAILRFRVHTAASSCARTATSRLSSWPAALVSHLSKPIVEHALQAHCQREMVLYWARAAARPLHGRSATSVA